MNMEIPFEKLSEHDKQQIINEHLSMMDISSDFEIIFEGFKEDLKNEGFILRKNFDTDAVVVNTGRGPHYGILANTINWEKMIQPTVNKKFRLHNDISKIEIDVINFTLNNIGVYFEEFPRYGWKNTLSENHIHEITDVGIDIEFINNNRRDYEEAFNRYESQIIDVVHDELHKYVEKSIELCHNEYNKLIKFESDYYSDENVIETFDLNSQVFEATC